MSNGRPPNSSFKWTTGAPRRTQSRSERKNENAGALGLSTRRPRHSDLALLGEAAAIAKTKRAAARSEPPPAGKGCRPGVYLTFVRTVRSNLVATMKVGLHHLDVPGALVPPVRPRRSLV